MKKKKAYQAFNFTKLLTAWSCLLDSSVFPPSLLSSQRELPEERENEHLISWRRPPSSPTLTFKNHPPRPHSAAADTKGTTQRGWQINTRGVKSSTLPRKAGMTSMFLLESPPLLPPPVSTVVSGGVFPSIDEGFKSPQVRIGRRPAENDSSCVFFLRYFLMGEFWNSVARGCHFTGVRLCGWQEVW